MSYNPQLIRDIISFDNVVCPPFQAKYLVLLLAIAETALARPSGHAHSFQHFHGPVNGEEREVIWVDEHGKKQRDYAAPAHYEFAYGVEDHNTGDYHGQKEHRDGKD